MKSKKPRKRIILYWFVENGFFFLAASLFILATFLKYSSYLPTLTLLAFNLTFVILIIGLLLLLYQWFNTEYFFLKKHLFIKKLGQTHSVAYDKIKSVGYQGNLLQHLMGTTNVRITTKDNKKYFISGIKNYKKIEDEILKRMK